VWQPSAIPRTHAADTLRYTYLLDALVRHHHHSLLVGPTGTGKTVYVKRHLQTGLPRDAFVSMVVTFSAQTSANMTQVRCFGLAQVQLVHHRIITVMPDGGTSAADHIPPQLVLTALLLWMRRACNLSGEVSCRALHLTAGYH
jgi:hypothetical protein